MTTFDWDEDAVNSMVSFCVSSSFVSLHMEDKEVADRVACLGEHIGVEVLDWGSEGSIPESEEELIKRLTRAGIMDTIQEFNIEEDEMTYLLESLLNTLSELTYEEEEGEDLADGECELCERLIPITRHHVHPKMVHNWCEQHLGKTKKELHHTIGICRPCHNAVHRLADHKKLAEFFNTTEKLLATPEILKFASWAKTQRVKGIVTYR